MHKRRELTQKERKAASALAKIWRKKKEERKFSQLSACSEMGFSSQSSISQFLNAKIALNTDAKIKFARFLCVKIQEFDPDFGQTEAVSTSNLIRELAEEASCLNSENQMKLVAFAKGLRSAQTP